MQKALESGKLYDYLLGQLPEQEAEAIERGYLADDELFEQLLAVEDELIDSYARNELSAADRHRFQEYFLKTPERAKRVEFARSFTGYVAKHGPKPKAKSLADRMLAVFRLDASATRFALAAAAVVVLGLGVLLVTMRNDGSKPPTQTAQTTVPSPTPLPTPSPAPEVQPKNEKHADSTILAFLLTPGLTRGIAETRQLTIAAPVKEVQLQLSMNNTAGYNRFLAILETAEGEKVLERKDLRQRKGSSSSVSMTLPADKLESRDYVIRLLGQTESGEPESIAEYSFRVLKR